MNTEKKKTRKRVNEKKRKENNFHEKSEYK